MGTATTRLQQESTDITKLLKLLRLKLRTNIDHPLTPPVNNRWPSRYHCATLVEEDRTPTDLGTPQQPENHSTTTDDIEINSTAADIGDDYDIDDMTVPDSEDTTVQPPIPVAKVPPFSENYRQETGRNQVATPHQPLPTIRERTDQ